MGNCLRFLKSSIYANNRSENLTPLQLQMLSLIYADFSSRSVSKGITREQFDVLFHLNGLWSASIYKKFDKNMKSYISFEDFTQNLLIMTKGDFDKKSQVLYDLYTEGQSQGVTYEMLTKMFYSYPKKYINKMVLQEKFLRTIDRYQLTCFFDEENKIRDNITMEIVDSINIQQDVKIQVPSIEQIKKMSEEMILYQKKISHRTLPSSREILQQSDQFIRSTPIKVKYQIELQKQEKKKRKNSFGIQKQVKRKKFKLTSNLSFLVKKYVTFLFQTYHVDPKKGSLNLQKFRALLSNHENIFNIYLQAFHSYIWHCDEKGKPLFKKMKADFQSQAFEKVKGKKTSCYLMLIRTTLFVLHSKRDFKPSKIINLEGLHVKQTEYVDNCLTIYHRDGVYNQQHYQFKSQQLKQEWLRQLSDFIKGNVNDDFQFVDAVGTGMFAQVYYGRQKATGQQVAIKVIDKNQLSKYQRLAVQKQCSILRLCHNPYIIKFYNHYETKNHLCIITEFIKDGDLFQYVKEKVFLDEYEAALIFRQLLESIRYLNELGLIHRDLKPQNIMIQMNDQKSQVKRVKLIDFGFAIFKKDLEICQRHQKYAGTPGFMAPQMLFGQDFDESADLFSLGIILYFMLSGFMPFYSPIYQQIIEQTKNCNVVLRNSHWANVSQSAKDMVLGLLTYKNERLTFKQVIQHQWLKDIESLKQFNGMNRKGKRR